MDQVSDVVDALIKIKLAMRGTSQDIETSENDKKLENSVEWWNHLQWNVLFSFFLFIWDQMSWFRVGMLENN